MNQKRVFCIFKFFSVKKKRTFQSVGPEMLSLVTLQTQYKHIAMNEASSQIEKERVQVYVDGFNLYFGMLEAGFDNCKWLNLKNLSINLLKPHQELAGVKYFTSRVSNNPDKQKRQVTYLEALDSV